MASEPLTVRPSVASPRVDLGRVVAVSLFTGLIVLNGSALVGRVWQGSGFDVLSVVNAALTVVVYAVLVVAYLRRAPARTSDRHAVAWVVGLGATVLPFLVPLVSDGSASGAATAVTGAVLLAVGFSAMVWGLTALGTNISVIPQARSVATTGPYALVRHPLYSAEIVAVAGMCLSSDGVWHWLLLPALVALQYARARREERLLQRELVGYADYRARTPMLVPRFF